MADNWGKHTIFFFGCSVKFFIDLIRSQRISTTLRLLQHRPRLPLQLRTNGMFVRFMMHHHTTKQTMSSSRNAKNKLVNTIVLRDRKDEDKDDTPASWDAEPAKGEKKAVSSAAPKPKPLTKRQQQQKEQEAV